MTDLYERGSWSCTYSVRPVGSPPSLKRMLEIVEETKGRETGWPVWLFLHNRLEMKPRIVNGVIECWLNETQDGDFWRADPQGRMFLVRRFQEDTREIPGVEPLRFFELTLPVWRTGECLLHASRLAPKLGADTVELSMCWKGLKDRQLSTFVSPGRFIDPGRVCHEASVRSSITSEAAAIPDTLPELVSKLTSPLFAHFDFFEPPTGLYVTELERMRHGPQSR